MTTQVKTHRPFIRYLRDASKHPIAVVVFFKSHQGEVKFGWSKWNPHDAFDRKLGLVYAYKRSAPVAEMPDLMTELIGHPTLGPVPEFVDRAWKEAKKYFTPKPTTRKPRRRKDVAV